MSTHENSSWEPEYDDDEYADNETAALESQALQNIGDGSSSDGDRSSSDGDTSSSDDESTESPEHPGTGAPNNTVESRENNVRGLTRLRKLKKNFDGKKHVIEFDELGQFKGEYKYEIASYMGVLVRRDVGLRHLKWKEVKLVLRDKLRHELVIKEKEIREDENPSRSLLWRKVHHNKNGEYDDDDVREKAAQLVTRLKLPSYLLCA
ncbi:hypothetical protein MKW98_031721 [Papaver atlanticum]|uniref:Uncharacterized protein n=1 Tax=Papaver atlanticum TaxID=357466 RepID=A0AAD4X9K4_9MAGN|nr:hypothetical protein MKW98_031721 [Papaver atlanticum]